MEHKLSARRSLILSPIAADLTNKDIAREIGVSEQAVKSQVSLLLREFEVTTRAGLVGAAARRGLIRPAESPPSVRRESAARKDPGQA